MKSHRKGEELVVREVEPLEILVWVAGFIFQGLG
jgi:hypothetical protein